MRHLHIHGQIHRILLNHSQTNNIQDIIDNIDYIFHTHAKFYNMHDDYTETAVAIPEVIEAFKKAGYKGFLSSEYEGGEHLRDIGVNSIEQVRRHQEALRAAMEK